MSEMIRLVLTHIPAICFAAAAIIAALGRRGTFPLRLLNWLLLLAVGIDSLWAGLFHVLAPGMASQFIGWKPSPFEFEIGIADIALGVTAVAAFWRPIEFKSAVVLYACIFYVGVAIGHVHQLMTTNDLSPGNFGLLFWLTLLRAIVLPLLLLSIRRSANSAGANR